MKKRIYKILALVLALAMALSVLTACGSSTETSTDDTSDSSTTTNDAIPSDGTAGATNSTTEDSTYVRQTEEGTLTVGCTAEVDGFDPTSSVNYIGEQLVYETLFYIDPTTGEPEPMLAESYEYQDDTHLYIKLRDEATFSNGDPVTCEDVLWSWYRTVEAQSSEAQNLVWIDFDNTEIVNDKEMVIACTESFGPAINFLCMFAWASVLDKSAMENASADDYWSNPVGSGPYTVVENTTTGTTYALNEDYWNADTMPEAKTIYVKNYTDASTMMVDYETGALDVVFNLATVDGNRVLNGEIADTNYKLLNNCDVMSVAYPEYTESLSDIRVRQALTLGIDKEFVVDMVWGGLGVVANSLLPTFLPQAVELDPTDYDPDQAIALLAEAGYDESNPLELTVVIVNEDMLVDLATVIQQQWAEIGVVLNVDSCDLSTAISHYMNAETDIIFDKGGGMSSYHPYEILQMSTIDSSNATIRISDETFNEYCTIGKTSTDEAESNQAYADAQYYLADNWLRCPLAEQYSVVIYRPYIANVDTLGGTDNINVRWVDFA
jgi:ABC-type transport system substrate-binding protein